MDPLASVEHRLARLPARGLEVRRFRRSMQGFGLRAALFVLDEFVIGGEDVGGSDSEGDEEPGLEVVALTESGTRENLGELHPIDPVHMWAAQARVMRMAQRRGIPVHFRGEGRLSSPVEFYGPVGDRLGRPPAADEVRLHDPRGPAASLRDAGWTVAHDESELRWEHSQRPRPGLALLIGGFLALWVIAVPILLLGLLFRPVREFARGIFASLWHMGTKRDDSGASVRVTPKLVALETWGGRGHAEDRDRWEIALGEIFAVGRPTSGWSAPALSARSVVLWTDRGRFVIPTPEVKGSDDAANERRRRQVLALEGWVWSRLAVHRDQAAAVVPRQPEPH